MNAKNFRNMIVLATALFAVSAGLAHADKLALQEKLSKNVQISLTDVSVAEALEKIGEKAGVHFVLSDEAAWKLPHAEATRLSVILEGPLADSMTEMLNAFFMRYAVGHKHITIYPRSELEHILGRPTPKQLELLKAAYTKPIRVYYLDQLQKTVNTAMDQEVLISPINVQKQLNDLLRELVGIKETVVMKDKTGKIAKVVREPDEQDGSEFDLPTPVTLAQLLRQVTITIKKGRGRSTYYNTARWYIPRIDFTEQIPEIRVVPVDTFKTLTRTQKIDVSYHDESLDKIFQELANRSGRTLYVGKDSYLNEHRLSVSMQNIPVEQAIINIAAMAGVGCDTDGSAVSIAGPGKPQKYRKPKSQSNQTKAPSDDYAGKISIPIDGGKYYIEFMLRESDLSDELKNLRTEKMKEIRGQTAEKPAKENKEN